MATRAAARAFTRPLVEYRRILVPLVPEQGSDRAVAVACGLAAEHGSSVTAVIVIEVPPELPLDAHMLDEEEEARRLHAGAQAIGDLYGVDVEAVTIPARSAGKAIVQGALQAQSEIIVLRAPRKRRLGRPRFSFGKTVRYVLEHAPCRVLVTAPPPA